MSVLRDTLEQMTEAQIAFICREFSLTPKALLRMSEEELDEVYDGLCDIESEETVVGEELSERGKLAVDLVTLMGNAIAESEGYFDEPYW